MKYDSDADTKWLCFFGSKPDQDFVPIQQEIENGDALEEFKFQAERETYKDCVPTYLENFKMTNLALKPEAV